MHKRIHSALEGRALAVDRVVEEIKSVCAVNSDKLIGLDANMADCKLIVTLTSEQFSVDYKHFNPVTHQFVF